MTLFLILALAAGARTLDAAGSETTVRVFEVDGQPWYSIEREGQEPVTRRAGHRVLLGEAGGFDPLEGAPEPAASLDGAVGVYLVQYETQPLCAYQDRVRALGGELVGYVPQHTNLVRMSDEERARVAAEPFVRAVVPFHAALRLEPWLLDRIGTGELDEPRPYNLWAFDRDAGDPAAIAARIEQLGGELRDFHPRSSLLGALLTEQQLVALLHADELMYADRHTALEPDLDLVRVFSGADALELATGFSGQGVKGEVADQAVETTHPGFQHHGGVQLHGPMAGASSFHGTAVYGIVFGDGTGSPGLAGRGILPDGMGIFADGDSFGWLNNTNPTNRAQATAELVDPAGPYRGTFQTSSLGSSRTPLYTTISANMDQIALDTDLVIVQALGNSGNPDSRPEAWGKNIVAVGGIYHQGTLTEADDAWSFGASSGPASDGRIKPEFAHFYDLTFTATTGGGYANFGGSSGSTPITAGHFGLFFQMWHADVFHNAPTGADPFESKPHRETAVAAMVNTAEPWEFSGANHDLNRLNQGWGRVDVRNLYERRDVTVFRDRVVIDNLEVQTLPIEVAAGEALLKVTMVYRDPPGVPGSVPHRINDLSLRVIDPQGGAYHGNVGLLEGNESQPGGQPDALDPIENVWITNPTDGTWTVEVTGVDVNTDLHPGLAGNNADYALWITGATDGTCASAPVAYCTAGTSASGCRAALSASGTASASAPSGFDVIATGVEAGKNALFFFGANGRQANPWGNGSSYQCVAPPVSRGALLAGSGSAGTCEGSYTYDLNARWTAKPSQNPGAGATVQAQLWYRDPMNTSNQPTSLSDAIELGVCP